MISPNIVVGEVSVTGNGGHTFVVKQLITSSSALSLLGGRGSRACEQPGCAWAAAKAADVVLSSTSSILHAPSLSNLTAQHRFPQLPIQGLLKNPLQMTSQAVHAIRAMSDGEYLGSLGIVTALLISREMLPMTSEASHSL